MSSLEEPLGLKGSGSKAQGIRGAGLLSECGWLPTPPLGTVESGTKGPEAGREVNNRFSLWGVLSAALTRNPETDVLCPGACGYPRQGP